MVGSDLCMSSFDSDVVFGRSTIIRIHHIVSFSLVQSILESRYCIMRAETYPNMNFSELRSSTDTKPYTAYFSFDVIWVRIFLIVNNLLPVTDNIINGRYIGQHGRENRRL